MICDGSLHHPVIALSEPFTVLTVQQRVGGRGGGGGHSRINIVLSSHSDQAAEFC